MENANELASTTTNVKSVLAATTYQVVSNGLTIVLKRIASGKKKEAFC